MNTERFLRIGDVSDGGQVIIVDEDRLCYLVKSESRGSIGLRTISKSLLNEYIAFFIENPNSNAETARKTLSGKSEIDKFEYGYTSTLTIMAKMVIDRAKNVSDIEEKKRASKEPLQQIFYGAPGTGKSFTINRDTKGEDVIRTTFHPDTDYSSFVGAYKPTTIEEPVMTVIGTKLVPVENAKPEKKIIYEFVSQAFLQAYVGAWRKYAEAEQEEPKKQFLIIEEINRGNCAQIFGDLFQLLDRNSAGFSDYPITADADMKKQLQHLFEGCDIEEREKINALYEGQGDVAGKVLNGDILLLPNNMYIWATMNTSDQSLFPIDSAFKRRWNWTYIPISNRDQNYKIKVNDSFYDWWEFLKAINSKIWDANHSEDKKLGYFFVKADDGIIKPDIFVGKVIFYLWNDVFKDFIEESGGIFNDENGDTLSFDKFYETLKSGETKVVEKNVEQFLKNLDLTPTSPETSVEEEQTEGKTLRVTFPDGTIIEEDSAVETYFKTITKIGVERVYNSNIRLADGTMLVGKEEINSAHRTIGEYKVLTGLKHQSKVKYLRKLSEALNLNLNVEYND